MRVNYNRFVSFLFTLYNSVERLSFCVFERAFEGERRALFGFCGFENGFSVRLVDPNHRHFEVVKNEVEHLTLDHLVGHIFPNANHTFHTGKLRRPEREQSFDERGAYGASVTLFYFKVARQGFTLVERDFTADFREVFNMADGDFASCSLKSERVISDDHEFAAHAFFTRKSAVREGR